MDKCSSHINESFRKIMNPSCLKELWKTIDATDISLVPFPSLFTAPESDCFSCQVTHTSCPCHQCCGWLHHKDEQDKWCPTRHQELQSPHPTWHKGQTKTLLTRFWLFFVGEMQLVPEVLGKPIHFPPKKNSFQFLYPHLDAWRRASKIRWKYIHHRKIIIFPAVESWKLKEVYI